VVSTASSYDDALLDALARVFMEVALERLLAEARQAEVRTSLLEFTLDDIKLAPHAD